MKPLSATSQPAAPSPSPAATAPEPPQPADSVAPPPAQANQAPAHAFTDLELLAELDPQMLRKFFAYLGNDFRALNIQVPDQHLPDTEFCRAAANLLLNPDSLPERPRAVLSAVAELASPRNRQLLRNLLSTSGIHAEALDSPDRLAFEYYLRSPFRPEEVASLHSRVTSAPQPEARETGQTAQSASPTDSSPPPAPSHSQTLPRPVPGDLAAIARFPRNKISHLSAEAREAINRMLRMRLPHHQILKELGDAGKHLNKDNLSRWKKTGYLLWLREQEKREEAQAQLQFLLDLVRQNDNGTIHEAAQQLAALKICYALADLDLAALKQSLQQDPAAFLRLVQALPRLSQGGMNCEHLRLALEERKIELEKEKIPQSKRVPTREELMEIARQIRLI